MEDAPNTRRKWQYEGSKEKLINWLNSKIKNKRKRGITLNAGK